MPRIARSQLLDRFRAKIAAGQPIIGGGAGTGLSAKCEEAGGIDLIVIYNSGRYRMAGRGSLAGLLAYGNANEIVCDMAREVLPHLADGTLSPLVEAAVPMTEAARGYALLAGNTTLGKVVLAW